jgi:hypothetical protein
MYAALFGSENIHVMLLESFSQDPEVQTDLLLQKMGLAKEIRRDDVLLGRKNTRTTHGELVGYKYRDLGVKRFVPMWLRKMIKNCLVASAENKSVRVEFSDEDLEFLSGFYGPGNLLFQGKTGLDLCSAGYPMGEM